MKMDILDRYFFKFFLKTFIGTLLLLTGIALIVKIMDSMKYIGNYKAPAMLYIQYYAYSSPTFLTYIIPPSLMFSVAFTVANFSKNFELTVIMAAGRSFKRLMRSVFIFSGLLAIGFFFFNAYISFPFSFKMYDIMGEIQGRPKGWRMMSAVKSSNLAMRVENRYYTIASGNWLDLKLTGFHFIELGDSGKPVRLVDAEIAFWKNDLKIWELTRSRESLFNTDGSFLSMNLRDTSTLKIPEDMETFKSLYRAADADERSIFDAYDLYKTRKKYGGDYRPFLTEVWWHAGYPLVCIFITFIGGMIGGTLRKGAISASIGLSMIFTIIYFFLMYFGTAFGETGTLPPPIAGNLANIISLSGALYLNYKLDY